jgi:hypothetical protein
LAIFGVRVSAKRRASGEFSVFGSRNCFLDLLVWIVKRSFGDEFSPSAQTAIRHGLRRVLKMMAISVWERLIRFGYPESRNG